MVKKKSGNRSRFPHKVKCRNDFEIVIRPLRIQDVPIIREFHKSLEPSDKAFLPEDILNPHYNKRVKRQIEDKFTIRLIAWHDEKIVAILEMYKKRQHWLQHTCILRAVCHPDHRRKGITLALMEEAIPFAEKMNIEKLYIELMPEQKGAIRFIKTVGFRREATFRDYVKDEYGTYHDVRVYSMDLEAAHKAMEALFAETIGYSG